ncbi:hypothetical protein BOTBODRAFT_29575 [Botryobasidium botryosum FD-172 SS1]|uniref:Structural maintenance of chromosomes protein n=1 Tax=Botryobasidium botryosum (strain FD-172 SS1) TaxID=930990 RepID=A0A067MR67_BOTB1|nr:hypothetical protein BOTBODRAFT_29575 [Botryobasidium botryosum FD-172 SS1]
MPPRRSTRSSIASTASVKSEKSASKPVSRRSARVSTASSAAAPVSKASTTRGGRKKDVIEEEEEEEEADEEEEDEEEEEEPLPPPKRGARQTARSVPPASKQSRARGSTAATKKGRKVVEEEEDDEAEVEEKLEETVEEQVEDEGAIEGRLEEKVEEKVEEEAEDEEGDEDEDELLPPPKRHARQTPLSATPPPKAKKARIMTSESESNTEEDDAKKSSPARPATQSSPWSSPVKPVSTAPPPPAVPQGPQTRLVIHKMVLVNFKSYKGRQEIGPFHKSFSAIVGPNGSGKSNTIDALLFVFGYRASKMRQGRLSELIHNSSAADDGDDGDGSVIDFCSVEVHFREIIDLPGPDAYEVVPRSNLVVARTAYQNNTSKYTINDRPSNFTEVTTLLKERGIDLDHKRFLILQGEVESIAQMKPKAPSEHEDGLLEYLEDIIGTSKYKAPIEESSLEVERLNEERVERLNRLKIVEREKGGLEAKKKEAEDFLRDQNALVRAQSLLAQHNLWLIQTSANEIMGTIESLQEEMEEERDRNKETIAESEELKQEYEQRVAAFEVVKKETEKLVKNLAVHEKAEVQFQEKKKHLISKRKKLEKALNEDRHAQTEAESWIDNHQEKIEKCKAELEELEASLETEEAELESIRDGLKDKTEVFHAQIEAKQKELEPWNAKISEKQAVVDIATNEKALLSDKIAAVQTAVQKAAEALEALKTDAAAKDAELEELGNEQATLTEEVEEKTKRLQKFDNEIQRLRGKVSSSRQKTDEARASQAANTSQNAVLDSLQRLKAAGRIHGFHGRLGGLGTIPEKYDVAVSTACPALNNLVVDTVDQGQACIEYLRKQNVGRASFIVLDKLPTDNPALKKIDTPENVPRLFDLIKLKEPRFAPAFFKGLGNTLVADDLEQANRIAYGQRRWRVVTLAGQLIDTSGTMSGGGTRVAKGGMSSKLASDAVPPEVLRQYEKETGDAEAELEKLVAERKVFQGELDAVNKKIPEVGIAVSKVELDIQTTAKRMAEAEKRVKELKSQSKPNTGDLKRIQELEGEITAASKEADKLREKSGKIDDEIKSLQNKILEIGGVRMRSQKAKVDGIKGMIDLATEQLTKSEVGKAKSEKDVQKLAKSIESNEGALEELNEELEKLESDFAECAEDVAAVRKLVEEVQDKADSAKQELAEMKVELDEKMGLMNDFRAKEMEIKRQLEEAEKSRKHHDQKIKHWQDYHDQLELQEIDEDEDEENGPEAHEDAEASEPKAKVKSEEGAEPAAKHQKTSASFELEIFDAKFLSRQKINDLTADVALLEDKLKRGKPNLNVLAEYRRRETEFLDRAKDLEKVTENRDAQKKRYDELRKARLEEFMAGFNTISSKLKEMYQMITLGGNAELELVDSMDPFSEGIIFSVMPPKKSWKNISNLSGGEKTLSSLALVFALHVFKPTPLYFMDEIDAALDFRNVSIVANYIKDRTKNAQFIIISLRNDMFELSHRLIGIYKTSNATRSISIDNRALTT